MFSTKFILPFSIILTVSQSSFYAAEQGDSSLHIQTITTKLGIPWGMALLPDNSMLITQREGILSKLNLRDGTVINISGLPSIKVKGQGGLFDVALSPNFDTTAQIYISYSKDVSGQGATTLSRAKLVNDQLTDWQDLIVTNSISKTSVHYGGRIAFDQDNHVFLTVGDRGVRANAQDLNNHAGSILRLNLDGSIPEDNPYANDDNSSSEVWSYGHRNPQGLFFNPVTHQMWAIEHGPRGGDEINLIKANHNYGWPVVSYGKEYYRDLLVGQTTNLPGMEPAIKTYVPSIAPSGLIQYSGIAFPEWKDNFLTGSLKLRHLNKITLSNKNEAIEETRLLRSIKGRIRNVIEDHNGFLYIATDDGRILRIKPEQNL